MKSGNPNFLEPSGPLRACNGTALPFYRSLSSSLCSLLYYIFRKSDKKFSGQKLRVLLRANFFYEELLGHPWSL